MPPINTITVAPSPKRFQETVRRTMDDLMKSHGFDRATATDALVTAMSAAWVVPVPTEAEVYALVNSVGIGSLEAKAALMVAATLDEIMRQESLSLPKALVLITKRMTTKHVLEHLTERQGGKEAVDIKMAAPVATASGKAALSSTMSSAGIDTDNMMESFDSNTSLSEQNSMMASKLSKQPLLVHRTAASARKTRTRQANVDKAASAAQTTDNITTRSRADSIDLQVHDKLETAGASTASEDSSSSVVAAAPTTTRSSKRLRAEEASGSGTAANTATLATLATNKRPRRGR
ncbi:hypothetical protein MPSEU_000785100 [Mayamaea pseudoterrestris]|nr:hypothetical protein MPSEU_000785100 [Mayamaea pseudoterrestris]